MTRRQDIRGVDLLLKEKGMRQKVEIAFGGEMQIRDLKVLRKMKKLDEDIKVIVLTGSASIDNAVQALRHNGAFDFLIKPLKNGEQLIIVVKQALEKSRLNREKNTFIRKLRILQFL